MICVECDVKPYTLTQDRDFQLTMHQLQPFVGRVQPRPATGTQSDQNSLTRLDSAPGSIEEGKAIEMGGQKVGRDDDGMTDREGKENV